ncbi:MAG: DUF2309 family protein [Betaproteobacteria bacterium]|nr:DUF2309 family protein [Betaproteobacteria bacterium]MDE2424038.1 DUF2309 family protein [Betaproteobacteria bacterium]
MKPHSESLKLTEETLSISIKESLSCIAPQWSLTQQIAVNPFWHKTHQSFKAWTEELYGTTGHLLTGEHPLISQPIDSALLETARVHYHRLYNKEAQFVAEPSPSSVSIKKTLYHLMDERKYQQHHLHEAIRLHISQTTAAFADKQQSQWHDNSSKSLFTFWRNHLDQRWNLEFHALHQQITERLKALPEEVNEVILVVVKALELSPKQWQNWFQLNLFTFPGWASWCAYQDQYKGESSHQLLLDLLAITLVWDYLVDDGERHPQSVWYQWQLQWQSVDNPTTQRYLDFHYSQLYFKEYAYQQSLIRTLSQSYHSTEQESGPHTQLIFCIDVRSEPMRRALEEMDPGIHTIGFAGFFGLPVTYHAIGDIEGINYCHGLLQPIATIRQNKAVSSRAWLKRMRERINTAIKVYQEQIKSHPFTSLLWVEGVGLGYAVSLLANLFKHPTAKIPFSYKEIAKESLLKQLVADEESQLTALKNFLVATGLKVINAQQVVIVGHGAQSVNNPYLHALDCGACGGQSGALNAKLVAEMLNTPAYRQKLIQQGFVIPQDTRFIAAHHNTTAQVIELLSGEEDEAGKRLQQVFDQAAQLLNGGQGIDASQTHREKTHNWAQVRPEWGLINNAAMIVAPRARTRGCDLQARVFLHEYEAKQDTDLSQLEQILLAPMIVAHWINMSYFTSRTLPTLFGSGNKLLHNVVGGDVGVFEGNSGDLRIGLAKQSLHDGQTWLHEAQRLTVIIDAPQNNIAHLIQKHALLRSLIDGGWIHLLSWQGESFYQYKYASWIPFTKNETHRRES